MRNAHAAKTNDSKRAIGERMRARRKRLNMSQQEVADELGKDRATYSQYEIGRNQIPAADLERLAVVMRVPVSYFFGEMDEEGIRDHEMVAFYNGLRPAMKSLALAQIRALHDAQDAEDDEIGRVGKMAE